MVYLRSKKVKGIEYLYLVRSVWDAKNSTSKQETIKYLGRASTVTPSDIPKEYGKDPNVLSFLSSHNPKVRKTHELMIKKLRTDTLKKMLDGDLDSVISIFDNFSRSSTMIDFYEKILRPVMYEIGDLWEKKKITSATEHVSSNIAQNLVKSITTKFSKSNNKRKILICTPEGEWHNLGCNIIESVLLNKGYDVQNISPSLPHDSIINRIQYVDPDALIISVTLKENLRSAKRLIQKISEKYSLPILVGGQAVDGTEIDAITMNDGSLEEMLRLLKSAI
ncbi:MAG TPA: cobalamin-dependent protein [Nitrosopumilaceae archaeon]|nr:cobalamin-dependent protein [Nitrosopumilaceae archaeon]